MLTREHDKETLDFLYFHFGKHARHCGYGVEVGSTFTNITNPGHWLIEIKRGGNCVGYSTRPNVINVHVSVTRGTWTYVDDLLMEQLMYFKFVHDVVDLDEFRKTIEH